MAREHKKDATAQLDYYAKNASSYDEFHLVADREHDVSFSFMVAMAKANDIRSALDLGAGTGRVSLQLREHITAIRVVGIEPSLELRQEAQKKGLGPTEIVDGDACNLPFKDQEFDLVCAFATLHHIAQPHLAVREMLRVARKMVCISDANRFGQGSLASRLFKRITYAVGAGRFVEYARTGGRRYHFSEGDGLFYSYSVFDNWLLLTNATRSVHVLNTQGKSRNHFAQAGHVCVVAVK